MRIKSMLQFASMILLALWVSSASAAADGSGAGTLTPREIIAQAQAAAGGETWVHPRTLLMRGHAVFYTPQGP